MWQGAGGRIVADRYALEAVLHGRGLGVVWRARDLAGDRPVVVKRLRPPDWLPAAELPSLAARIGREVAAAAAVRHPAVAAVYDLVDEGGQPAVVMELVDGVTLHELVRRHGPLPPRRVAQLGAEALAGLAALHQAGVLHGAVSPGTVLVTPTGTAKLVGAGSSVLRLHPRAIAAAAGSSPSRVLAPELVAGEPPGPAVDVWAGGATLHYAVTGRPPMGHGAPPGPAGELGPVLARLLAPDPAERPSAALAAELLTEAAPTGTPPRLPDAPLEPRAGQAALVPSPGGATAVPTLRPATPPAAEGAAGVAGNGATVPFDAVPPAVPDAAATRVEQPREPRGWGGPPVGASRARAAWRAADHDRPRDALAVGLIAVLLAVLAVLGLVVGIRVLARLTGADQPATRPRLAAPPTSPPPTRVAVTTSTAPLATTTTTTTSLPPLRVDREAEAAVLAGGARPAPCDRCSGNTKVGFVGNGGTLTFTGVAAPGLGSYQLSIWYASGERRDALLSIDGGQGLPITFRDSGGFDRVRRLSVTITLRAGVNTLTFFNPGGFAPDFDRIRIRPA